MNKTDKKLPSVWLSFVPLITLVGLISTVVYIFGTDSLAGASQISLLIVAAISVGLGMLFKHITWLEFENAVAKKISEVSQAIIILLLIGALSGAWMISGIVPIFIYYGLQILSPEYFLVATCIICSIVSLITGSSWTTVATIGIALIGVGEALGISEGWIAGAIISGAYFGDKISPLSDTTVLASSTVGVPLFTHIRYMLYTTIPSMLIAISIYTIYGLTLKTDAPIETSLYLNALSKTFNLSPLLLIVPLITGILIVKRAPSVVVLFFAITMGIIAAMIFQTHLLAPENKSFTTLFKGSMIAVYGSTNIDTGIETLNKLVATRGMAGMMDTIWLILCAMVFGGAMTATKMIESIMTLFLHFTKSALSIVASTVGVGTFMNTICGDQYLSIIMTTSAFRDAYQKAGFEPRLLSRTTEDSVTITSPLVPWNTCGMTQSTVLGVSVFAYAPYTFFNLLSPLTTIFVAAIGYKIFRKTDTKNSVEQ